MIYKIIGTINIIQYYIIRKIVLILLHKLLKQYQLVDLLCSVMSVILSNHTIYVLGLNKIYYN